jgi:phosphatidylinositol-3-phosphatase
MTSSTTRRAGTVLGAAVTAALSLAAGGPAAAHAQAQATVSVRPARAGVQAAQIPRYSHIVVVIEENKPYAQIIGNTSQAPYINSLAAGGALFTQSYGVTYPSQPNYLALFAGSTFGVTTDNCPQTFSAANLGSELRAAGLTYSSYSESMPRQGYKGCKSGEYVRKHNPAPDFSNLPGKVNKTFAQFPTSYGMLPRVAFVAPNLLDDMHSASIAAGDSWLQANMNGYVQWAQTHNSLLILTWDTDNTKSGNHIATLFVGANIVPGQYSETINHYNVLRTIEQAYGLPYAGQSASAAPITDVFSG